MSCAVYWLNRNLFYAVNTGINLDIFLFKSLKNTGGGGRNGGEGGEVGNPEMLKISFCEKIPGGM